MKEIDELSSGIERLKKNSDSQKRLIEQLQKDRAFLIERTRFLGQKLGEAYVIYEEAGKRILDFVDKETAPIKNQIAELKAETGKISAMQQELKIHSSYLSKVRSGDETLKAQLLETEKAIKKLSEMAALAKTHIDRLKEKEAKEDEALESRLADIKGHFETQLKTSQERIVLRISEASEEVLQDATDSINALAGSHEELRKHLSQTSLFVKQLKVSTASIKKQLENAGFARSEIEKKVSGNQASIKSLDSAVSKLTRRLEGINLEDEKLEKRLAELRRSAEESISSKVGQLKVHVDSHQKRQSELLDGKIGNIEKRISEVRKEAGDMIVSKAGQLNTRIDAYQKRQDEMLAARLRAVSEDFAARVAKINERLLAERKQMGDIESLINGKMRDSEKNAHLIKGELEKRLSLHQGSIREIDSAISKMARRLEGINLEDEKLEKRLAELRRGAEESIISKVGQLKAHVDSREKNAEEKLSSRISGVNELLESRISWISGTLDEKVAKINERLADEKKDLSLRIERQNAAFAKLAKDQHVSFESAKAEIDKRFAASRTNLDETLDSKASLLKAHLVSHQNKQDELVSTKLKVLSDDFAGKMAKVNERLLAERKQMGDIESLINGKMRDSEKNAHLIKNELEKRLSLHQGSIREIDSAISKMARRLEGINLEDEKLEKRLAELRKKTEEATDHKIDRLKSHIELAGQKQVQLIETRLKPIAELEKRISEVRKGAEESIISKVGQLKAHVDSREKNAEEKLSSRISGVNELLESRISWISGTLDEKVAKINERLADEKKDLSLRIERQNAAFAKLAKDQHVSFESAKAEIEKRVAGARANLEEALDSKAARLKADVDSHQKRQAEFLDAKLKTTYDDFAGKIAKINERFAKERQDISDVESLISRKVAEAQKTISLREARLEKEIAGARKHAQLSDSSLSSRLEKQAADFRVLLKEQHDHVQSVNEEIRKNIADARDGAEEMIGSRTEQMKSHLDAGHKRQSELIETRLKVTEESADRRIDRLKSHIELAGQKQVQLIETRLKPIAELEKRISEVRKGAEESIISKVGQLKVHVDSHQKRQSELLDGKIGNIEKRISEVRKEAGDMIVSKAGQLNTRIDAYQKRQDEMLAARLRAVSEDFAARVAKINERLAGEKQDISEIESLINERIKGSQGTFDAKLAESYNQMEGKISQVSSHVASEKKAIEAVRASLEREIREEQKALSATMNALSEKSWKRVSGLSDEVSVEKKGLAEQRAKFSERMDAANQAIARLNEFAKSLDGNIRKYEDLAAGRMQKNEDAISDASKRIDSFASALEKSGSFSKDLTAKMGRLDSQAYSEKKALLEKVKSLESGLKASSLAISGLRKQLSAAGSSKASADKRISGLEARLKELQAADSGIGSRIEKHHIDFQNVVKEQAKNAEFRNDVEKRLSSQQEYVKGLESALARVLKMIENVNLEDKKLEARFSGAKEEMVRKLSEENRQLHEKTGKVSSVQDETAKRLAAMENSLHMLAEKASQSEKQFSLDVDGLKAQLAEAGKGLSKTGVRSAELKDYMSSIVKAEQDSAGAEISRLRGEIAVLKKDITEWQQEQARLYELLKED